MTVVCVCKRLLDVKDSRPELYQLYGHRDYQLMEIEDEDQNSEMSELGLGCRECDDWSEKRL